MLGEWVLPSGGSAWTSALLDALAAVGVEEKTARQAVARTADAGLLAGQRRGRRACWQLTPEATRLLQEGTERIYSFGRAEPEWDERWLLLLTSIPEASRHLRYRLRRRLGWTGFAPIGPGDWLSPWVAREKEALAVLAELGLAERSRSFVGHLGSLGDPKALVSEAWELDRLEKDYQAFMAEHRDRDAGSGADAFRAATLLVHEWRHFPNADPGLPGSLLPEKWSGREAAELFHQLHSRWAPLARQWWAERNPE